MARVSELFEQHSAARPHPTAVRCAVQVLKGDGPLLVQVSSYGSEHSESSQRGHVTQTYQFDLNAASQLIAYFVESFGEVALERVSRRSASSSITANP